MFEMYSLWGLLAHRVRNPRRPEGRKAVCVVFCGKIRNPPLEDSELLLL